MRRPNSSSVTERCERTPCSRCNCWRLTAILRASRSSSKTWNLSPAFGAPSKPKMETGTDGPASSTRAPRSLNMALTLPLNWPAKTASPMRMVPPSTSRFVTYPRPLSNELSTTVPMARLPGLAFKSSISASSSTFSSNSSMFVPFLAEISWLWNLPPHSSTNTFISDSSWRILSALASGRSILLMAMTMGMPAACAWLMASLVCGITASSAATTMIAMSVTWAPRARMAVKAS